MRNRQEWFNEKIAAVSPEIMSEVQLLANIIARIDAALKQKNMTQRDLAKRMGRSEAVISRWTSGFPNLTIGLPQPHIEVHSRDFNRIR